jgi:sugar lactone lactonase YvrE
MKLNGGVIGVANQPTNRVASGVWSRHEQYTNVLYNSFPAYFPGFDLTTLQNAQTVYRNRSLNVNGQDTTPNDLYIKPDGTAIYIVGASNDNVFQYNMTTPWDLSTASFSGTGYYSVSAQDVAPTGLFFSSDGTQMYISGDNGDKIYQYNISPAWAIGNATYSNVFLSTAAQDTTPASIYFKPDGLQLFLTGDNRVYQYTLTSAWNLATATYSGTSFSVIAQAASSKSLTFKPDGTKMFVGDNNTGTVYEYNLSSPWNIATAIYSFNNYKTVISTAGGFSSENPFGIAFDSTGTRLYVTGITTDKINQIDVGTPYTLTMTPGYAGSVSVFAQENIPREVSFSLDGTNMYVVGSNMDTVYQYSLSTAWDVTTAVYSSKSLSVGAQETSPSGLFFKPDGTKMYIIGFGTDTIYQYNLATPWDMSTASYDNISRVITQTASPQALFFGNNGLKLYVLNVTGIVYQYALSTAWNLSTVTYETKTFTISTNSYLNSEITTEGMFFSADGSKMFVMGGYTGRIYQYSLATSWDISTATYAAQINYSFINYDLTKPNLGESGGIYFKPDGTKMFIVGNPTDRVHQYFLTP